MSLNLRSVQSSVVNSSWQYSTIYCLYIINNNLSVQWRTRGGAPPSTRAPPREALRGGTHRVGSFNITSACISLPQGRHSGVPRGGAVVLLPPLEVPRGGPAPLENTKLKGNYV